MREGTTQKDSIYVLTEQLILHTNLFQSVIQGIEESDEQLRLTPTTNHLAWLAGSLVSARYLMINMIGPGATEPFPTLFAHNKRIQNDLIYPSLSLQKSFWLGISDRLLSTINNSSEREISQPSVNYFPTNDKTILGALIFLTDREGQVIGEMTLLRRLLGYKVAHYV